MEISYLVGIATRGFNTEFQLKEVRWGMGESCHKRDCVMQKTGPKRWLTLSTG